MFGPKDNMRTSVRLITSVGVFLCLTSVAATVAGAQTLTTVTVVRAVRVSGAVLAPGVYNFSTRRNAGRTNVLIQGVGKRFSMFVPVMAVNRLQSGPIVGLRSPQPGVVTELATWYPEGGTEGFQFAPLKAEPRALFPLTAGLGSR